MLIATVFIIGVLIGYFVTLLLQTHKGPSSRSVQKITYSKDFKFIPVIHVCPPSVDPGVFEHSSDDDD